MVAGEVWGDVGTDMREGNSNSNSIFAHEHGTVPETASFVQDKEDRHENIPHTPPQPTFLHCVLYETKP